LVGVAGQLARECSKLAEERDHRRGHDQPLMGRVTLNTQLLDDAKVTAANCIRKRHTGPEGMGHVSDGRQPNKL